MGKRINKHGENFRIELPLKLEKWQEDKLSKTFSCTHHLYNQMTKIALGKLKYFQQLNAYKNLSTLKEKFDFL